jgi:threonine dehydrogenase-like Zn-dependent dehydrogenase
VGKLAARVGHGKGFEIREYPVPESAPGAVVIRVSFVNVCGSAMHYWKAERGTSRHRGQRGRGCC